MPPALPFSTRAGLIDKVEMLETYESIEAPAPVPMPVAHEECDAQGPGQ